MRLLVDKEVNPPAFLKSLATYTLVKYNTAIEMPAKMMKPTRVMVIHGYLAAMKTIGLIGGLTWHSTIDYYRHLNQLVQQRLGAQHSARLLLHSVDFEEIRQRTFANDWAAIAAHMTAVARQLEQAGAHCLLLGANTMHHIAGEVQAHISIPLLHIADATAKAIAAQGLQTVALLGTRYTMQLPFYHQRLAAHGIQAMVPSANDQQVVHDAIYNEMASGIFADATRQQYNAIIATLQQQGARGVIMGCTEIPLLLRPAELSLPLFDTARLHAEAAVQFALGE